MLEPNQENTELARSCLAISGSHIEQCGQLIDIVEKFRPSSDQLKPVGRVLKDLEISGADLGLINSTRKRLIEIVANRPKAETGANIDSIRENCPVRLKVKLSEFQFVTAMTETTPPDPSACSSDLIKRMQAARSSVTKVAFILDWLCLGCEKNPGYVAITKKLMSTQPFLKLDPDHPESDFSRESATLLKALAWQTRIALLQFTDKIAPSELREISGVLREPFRLDQGATISISAIIKDELALLSGPRRKAIVKVIDVLLQRTPAQRPDLEDVYDLLKNDTELIRLQEVIHTAKETGSIAATMSFRSQAFRRRKPLFELDLSALPC